MSQLIAPHGGHLVDGLVAAEEAARLKQLSASLPSWDLTPRQMCDLEMLLNGAFSPLRGFMLRSDYESVRDTMRPGHQPRVCRFPRFRHPHCPA